MGNQISQPVQAPGQSKISNRLILTIIFGVPIFVYILFQISKLPLSFILISILFSDTSNAGLAGLAVLSLLIVIIAIFFGLISGLLSYLLIHKMRFFLGGFGVFMLIFVIHSLILRVSFENYLSTGVNTALQSVNEIVGKEKLIFTYVGSIPIYSSSGTLDEVRTTFKLVALKTGDYQIDSYLTTPYDLYGPKNQGVPRADTLKKTTVTLIEGVPFDLIVSFEMKSFVAVHYEGKLNLYFDVWRTHIQAKNVPWVKGPITDWPIDIMDSGKSPNYKISKDGGQEEPIYLVGPFYNFQP